MGYDIIEKLHVLFRMQIRHSFPTLTGHHPVNQMKGYFYLYTEHFRRLFTVERLLHPASPPVRFNEHGEILVHSVKGYSVCPGKKKCLSASHFFLQ